MCVCLHVCVQVKAANAHAMYIRIALFQDWEAKMLIPTNPSSYHYGQVHEFVVMEPNVL